MSAGVVLEERVAGTWQRLLATPARKVEIVLGYLFGFFINGWAQMGILIVATRLVFGVSWGNPLGLIVLTSVFILTATALGLAIAGIVKTPQQQSAAANIGAVVTSMVAGIYWPYEMMPSFMQKIGLLMPQYWAMRGYQELLARGGSLTTMGTPLLILGGIAVVLLGFGVSRVRFE
jgi:ABC-2 type transport system permease protein